MILLIQAIKLVRLRMGWYTHLRILGHDYIRRGINEYLGTDFSKEEMKTIYTYLGNGCNDSMCERFIASKFDMEVLKK